MQGSLVCTLNGQCSGICGGASFREERLTLAERGKIDVFKINVMRMSQKSFTV